MSKTPVLPDDMSESAMIVEYSGEKYCLDLAGVTIRQAMVIQGCTGMTLDKLVQGLDGAVRAATAGENGEPGEAADPPDMLPVMLSLWWLMRAQSGIREPIAEADVPLVPFLSALFRAMSDSEPDADGAAEPDPTSPSPPDDPPSPEPPGPKATTRKPRAKAPAPAGTG